MKKKEFLTFIILSINFIVTGMVIEREGLLASNYVFFPMALLAAFALTKYVFYISNNMGKGGKK